LGQPTWCNISPSWREWLKPAVGRRLTGSLCRRVLTRRGWQAPIADCGRTWRQKRRLRLSATGTMNSSEMNWSALSTRPEIINTMRMIHEQFMNKVKEFSQKPWFMPAVLLMVCLAAYGLQVNRLGFYWDDWEDVFLYHLGDPAYFWSYFAYDRPFTAWVYVVFFPLLRMNPENWQIFNILLRWLSLVGFWWVFGQVWPRRPAEVGWFTLLLAVFPGFTQQAVSVTYSRHFVSYALFSLSLVLMTLSLRKQRLYWLFTLFGVAAAWLQMMTIEYLFGLELLRPVLLWLLDDEKTEKTGKRLWKTFLKWLPYLAALGAFVYWRFFVFASSSPDPEANAPVIMANLLKDPLDEILKLAQIVAQDFVYLILFVWTEALDPDVIDLTAKATLFSWALGAAAAAGIGWLFYKYNENCEACGDHF